MAKFVGRFRLGRTVDHDGIKLVDHDGIKGAARSQTPSSSTPPWPRSTSSRSASRSSTTVLRCRRVDRPRRFEVPGRRSTTVDADRRRRSEPARDSVDGDLAPPIDARLRADRDFGRPVCAPRPVDVDLCRRRPRIRRPTDELWDDLDDRTSPPSRPPHDVDEIDGSRISSTDDLIRWDRDSPFGRVDAVSRDRPPYVAQGTWRSGSLHVWGWNGYDSASMAWFYGFRALERRRHAHGVARLARSRTGPSAD